MDVITYPSLNPDIWSHEYFNFSMYVHEYTIDIKSNELQKKIQLLIFGYTVLAIKDYFELQHCNLLVFAYAFGEVS